MKFSCNKEISYEEAVKTMFEKLGNAQIMALASSLNDYVMVRNVSRSEEHTSELQSR